MARTIALGLSLMLFTATASSAGPVPQMAEKERNDMLRQCKRFAAYDSKHEQTCVAAITSGKVSVDDLRGCAHTGESWLQAPNKDRSIWNFFKQSKNYIKCCAKLLKAGYRCPK